MLLASSHGRVILDEAPETGIEAGNEDDPTGDVALLSPSKMETLGTKYG